MHPEAAAWWFYGAATVVFAAVLCTVLIVVLKPLLARYALARPNARSSHKVPTPQGGGIAVVAATIVAAEAALALFAGAGGAGALAGIFAAAIVIAILGVVDDIRPLGVAPRLLLQAAAVALVIFTLPHELRVVPPLPWWIERVMLVIGGLWFVNLVNFMDGLDWMTVAEMVPITAALAALGSLGFLPAYGTVAALALCGAMIGFGYFNRPVAKLFLGDVGSLPIGLLVGWLLLLLAARGHLVAAIVLPLYYLADATITLLRRLFRGEAIWQAHRSHFYQRATDHGFTVIGVVARVFAANLALAVVAALTVVAPGRLTDLVAIVVGAALVAALLTAFARGKAAKT